MQLSHSQIEMFEQCRHRWYLTKTKKAPQAPAIALVLGTAFHSAMEELGKFIISPQSDTPDGYQVAITGLDKAVEHDTTGFLREHREEMMLKLRHMLTHVENDFLQTYHPKHTEMPFTILAGNVTFTGRIDAIDISGNIWDFKTASKHWDRGLEHSKPQVSAYMSAFPTAKKFYFAIFTERGYEVRETTRTATQIEDYKQHVRGVATAIENCQKTMRFSPNPGPLCAWCGVLGSCAIGQTYMQSTQREPQVPIVLEKSTSVL